MIHPFGFGLSYTSFAHSVKIGYISHRLRAMWQVEVFVSVANTGSRQGEESVLLFAKSPLVGPNLLTNP